MPREAKQKAKLLYIADVLYRNTDEEHVMGIRELIDILAEHDIFVERKTIISDIQTLKDFGMDIGVSKKRGNSGYYLISRDFELPELNLIVEAILSSRYITAKKSKDLIRKIESLASPSERKMIDREVFVSGRVKSENESIYYNVDKLHDAMRDNREVTFLYLDWTKDKKLEPRRNGKQYRVSPWALTVKDENYYLIAFDDQAGQIRHYRVDKMKGIRPVARSERKGKSTFRSFHTAEYTNMNFGMFAGEAQVVALSVPENKIGIIFDRFGRDVDVRPLEEGRLSVRVPVLVSGQFFGWLTGLGPEFRITMPKDVKLQYLDYLKEITTTYGTEE